MKVKIGDLMVHNVRTARPSHTIGRIKEVMREQGINSMPVVDDQGHPLGIVTSSDMLNGVKDGTKVSQVMTLNVHTIQPYADPSSAAKKMRENRIHHLVVVDEKRVVGMISSFDLLQLVEERHFVARPQPDKGGPRKKRSDG